MMLKLSFLIRKNKKINNLDIKEKEKLTNLNYEISELQKELGKINDLEYQIDSLVENEDKFELLKQSDNLNHEMEKIISKPIKENNWEFGTFEFEINNINSALEGYETIEKSFECKKKIIYELYQLNKKKEIELINKGQENLNKEIKEWIVSLDKYNEDIKNYNLVCYYCATVIDIKILNEKCDLNIHEKIDNKSKLTS